MHRAEFFQRKKIEKKGSETLAGSRNRKIYQAPREGRHKGMEVRGETKRCGISARTCPKRVQR